MNVLVVGPAKTGTTVVSKAIHRALPGAEYRLEPRVLAPFLQRIGPPGVVVKIIFEHWADRPRLRDAILHGELPLRFDRIVATMRDPRDEVVSRMYFVARERALRSASTDAAIDEWIELLREKERAPSAIAFTELCEAGRRLLGVDLDPQPGVIDRYLAFVASLPKRAFVLRYEDFVAGDVAALGNYLGLPIANDPELGRVDYTKRSGSSGEWRRIFTEADVERYRPLIGPLLAKVGYDDWSLEPNESLDPTTRSAYVRRLVDDVRAGPTDAPDPASAIDAAGRRRDAVVSSLGRGVVRIGRFLERSARGPRRR